MRPRFLKRFLMTFLVIWDISISENMQKNKEVINKSGILKIIGRKPEEFPEINGTKRLFSDQIVVEDML